MRLGKYVLDPRRLDHRAHGTAGDDARARSGGLEHDSRRAPLQVDFVRDRRPDHGNGDHVPLRDVHPLADRLGDLTRLADPRSHAAVHIADDDQRAERELPPALDDLGDAVDADDSVGQL